MIKGTKNWTDASCYYTQANNSIENILSTFVKAKKLETCGPTACVNALATMGYPVDIELLGDGYIQPEDVLTIYMNDQKNEVALQKMRDDIDPKDYMDNRVPQYMPYAIKKVFNVESSFSFGAKWDDIIKIVSNGQAVVVCTKDPSHYITIKAYDTEQEMFIYDDPWPNNYWPTRHKGTSGFNRRMNKVDFLNVKNFKVVINV